MERFWLIRPWSYGNGAVCTVVDLAAAMCMVEVAPVGVGEPFIYESAIGLYGSLRQTRYAV
jgi:hypothetical protein